MLFKKYIQIFKEDEDYVNNPNLPKKIVDKVNELADENNELFLSDFMEIFFMDINFFMSNPAGKKFFSLYSHGFTLEEFGNFNPNTITTDISQEEISSTLTNISNEINIPNINFNNPILSKIYREMFMFHYPQYSENKDIDSIKLDIKTIKKFTRESEEFKRIFDAKEEGKEVIRLISQNKLKTLGDVVNYLKEQDSAIADYHGKFLVDSNVDFDIKKYRNEKDTSFRGSPHYVFVVSLKNNALKKFLNVVNRKFANYRTPAGTLARFIDYYKSGDHSHRVVTIKDKFCIGWVRFTLYTDEEGKKRIIIDELQSDLTPDDINVAFDKYKTSLPAELYEEFFISQEILYQFILSSFIRKFRDEYNYTKIYTVDYDTKVQRSSMASRDFSKYGYIPSDEKNYIQQMKPPRFPYFDILKKKFNFSDKRSDLEGFLLLEKKLKK